MATYKSLFIVPINTKATLTDEGWDFESEDTLPEGLVTDMISVLQLSFHERHSVGIKYVGDGVEAIVIMIAGKTVARIFIKVYELGMLSKVKQSLMGILTEGSRLLVPSDEIEPKISGVN